MDTYENNGSLKTPLPIMTVYRSPESKTPHLQVKTVHISHSVADGGDPVILPNNALWDT